MDEGRRYRFRPGAVGYTRGHRVVLALVLGVALVLVVVGVLAAVLRAWGVAAIALGAAGIALGAAGVTIGLITLLARTNAKPPPT